ncbi:hypothetical protein PG991_013928 [Apiospora marii]|uniref:Heterokaryon incompatibility domain-containing protein n=1 Tax=Apiospora marii TaxID=335849 RepID=A0ABR1R7E6_9PEZI
MSVLYESHKLPAGSKCIRVLDVSGVPTQSSDEPVQGRLRVIPLNGTQKFAALSFCKSADQLKFDQGMTLVTKPRFGGSYPYVTYSDIEELLGRPWVTRLWTYQEIILAANPVVVCGSHHVPWSNFTLSLLFLHNIECFEPKSITSPWANIMINRENPKTSNFSIQNGLPTTLASYISLVRRISRIKQNIATIEVVIVIAGPPYSGLFALAAQRPITYVIFVCFVIWAFVVFHIFKMFPKVFNPDPSRTRYSKQANHVPSDGLAISLYCRKAKDPKDMAFGMWAVLKRAGASNLPAPDDSLGLGHVYWIFSSQLITTTQRLDLLLLAAAKGVHGEPSWVPDWSAYGNNDWDISFSNVSASHHYSGTQDHRYRVATDPPEHISLNRPQTVLTVRARAMKTPVEALDLLMANTDAWAVQLVLCNFLASAKKTQFRLFPFTGTFEPSSSRREPWANGCGSDRVQDGDIILQVQGVPRRLIVRERHGSSEQEQAVEIILDMRRLLGLMYSKRPEIKVMRFFRFVPLRARYTCASARPQGETSDKYVQRTTCYTRF